MRGPPSPARGEGSGSSKPGRIRIPQELHNQMVALAREFRREPTPTEAVLWKKLQRQQLDGYKFRRQQPIGPFIVDFFCPAAGLVVEVDGPIHDSQRERDAERQRLIEALGLRFVRLPTEMIENDLAAALDKIRDALSPSPLVGEGEREGGKPAAPHIQELHA